MLCAFHSAVINNTSSYPWLHHRLSGRSLSRAISPPSARSTSWPKLRLSADSAAYILRTSHSQCKQDFCRVWLNQYFEHLSTFMIKSRTSSRWVSPQVPVRGSAPACRRSEGERWFVFKYDKITRSVKNERM